MKKLRSKNLSFETITLENQVFSPALFEKIASGKGSWQAAKDYGLPKGIRISDEYGRAFQIAKAHWNELKDYEQKPDVYKALCQKFILGFLKEVLGYSLNKDTEEIFESEPKSKIMHISEEGLPIFMGFSHLSQDEKNEAFVLEGEGRKKRSLYGLSQAYLNTSEKHDWAICTNAKTIRLVMKNQSLVRPSFIEFDLEAIMNEERFPDFRALWYLLHCSRTTVWQKWRAEGIETGSRIHEGLRHGVTRALLELGSGFIKARANTALREKIEDGRFSKEDFYKELLRIVYRFLFLFTIEERGLLFQQTDDAEMRKKAERYQNGYSMARLKDICLRRNRYDRYSDLWQGVQIVFSALREGDENLALPGLGGIFSKEACLELESCKLENYYLLSAIKGLRWALIDNRLNLVDYQNMGTEEFGSIYESLLELVPVIDLASMSFSFVGIDSETGSKAGNARKTTGSYYTPDSLVQELVKSALVPLIKEKEVSGPDAILSLKIIDPACGSGHFLLAAARRIAESHAEALGGKADYQHSLRLVINKCIYGVDLNPMAVELARTALWLEGYEPGKPLGFLNHHIKCGNSLVGLTDLAVLKKGIPDAAYKALSGDDKKHSGHLRKRNQEELNQSKELGLFDNLTENVQLTNLYIELEKMEDTSLLDIQKKELAYKNFMQNEDFLRLKTACDLWMAAFFMEKEKKAIVPTSEDLKLILEGLPESAFQVGVREKSQVIAKEVLFFHWPIEFPDVFLKGGGFDCVLANPPWERLKLQEEEFFASRSPEIANAKNKAERGKKIADLVKSKNQNEKDLHAAFEKAKRHSEATSNFAHLYENENGRYPLTGIGDVNSYALFAELILYLKSIKGRAGFITPSGIATDDSTKTYFSHIATKGMLHSFYDFENRESLFPAVDSRFKFALQTLGPAPYTDFAFFLSNVSQLADERRHFTLSPEDFALINPNTKTCPVFRSQRDAELTKRIYAKVPVLIRDSSAKEAQEENPWGIRFQTMFHMSNDSHLFQSEDGSDRLPLYEAKMMHQFDHRWTSYEEEPQTNRKIPDSNAEPNTKVRDAQESEKADPHWKPKPRYWVDKKEVLARITSLPSDIAKAWLLGNANSLREAMGNYRDAKEWTFLSDLFSIKDDAKLLHECEKCIEENSPRWLMGWRNITNTTNERTVIASIIPRSAVGNNMPLFIFDNYKSSDNILCLTGNINSLVFDFIARHKLGGTNLNFFYIKQFPVLPPSVYSKEDLLFIVPRVLELCYSAYDIAALAEDVWNSSDKDLKEAILMQRKRAGGEGQLAFDAKISAEDKLNAEEFPPFPWNPERRALIRAQLDAHYARLYGLSREELCYILDPKSVMGEDYPSESFRVLKDKELKAFGEYRTMRLVLEAWDEEEIKANERPKSK